MCSIVVHLGRKLVLIGGTHYAGEIKKSIFTTCRRRLLDVRAGRAPFGEGGWTVGLTAFRHLPASTLALQLAEEILRADQMIVEDPPRGVEELRDEGIADRVPHAHALLAASHDVVAAQHRQLLRDDWLLHTKGLLQFLNVLLTLHQQFQDPDPNGVSEGSEERGLERLEVVGEHFSHVGDSTHDSDDSLVSY